MDCRVKLGNDEGHGYCECFLLSPVGRRMPRATHAAGEGVLGVGILRGQFPLTPTLCPRGEGTINVQRSDGWAAMHAPITATCHGIKTSVHGFVILRPSPATS